MLEAAGTNIDHVVKVNVFLADMKDFAAMNEIYAQYWGDNKPCRTYAMTHTILAISCANNGAGALRRSSCHWVLTLRSSALLYYRERTLYCSIAARAYSSALTVVAGTTTRAAGSEAAAS